MVNIKSFGPSTILGEAPHWDYNEKVLYYVDIYDARIFKYDPKTAELNSVKINGEAVSMVVPITGQKNKFVITVDRNLAILTWDGKSSAPNKIENIATVDTELDKEDHSVFNDGKADPTGRIWAGTRSKLGDAPSGISFLTPNVGSLYSFTKSEAPNTHVKNITCSNGLAWSKDLKKFYYIDTPDEKVYGFDFDSVKGTIANQKTIFDFKSTKTEGLPDGMTIDAEDKLWVACFGGSQVIRIDPVNGTLISKVEIPAPHVTSVTFGGPNFDELYVTTASLGLAEEEKKKYPLSGKTFHITGVGVKGTKNDYAKF